MEPTRKVLRIGVVLGSKLVEERLVHGEAPVTIGQSAKNLFSIPIPDLPRTWALFTVREGRYVLNLSAGMDCRLSQGGQVTIVEPAPAGRQVELAADARGKVVIGELTLLFQLVAAPPLAPRPELPRALRGGLAGSIDPYLTVVLAVSLLFHSALFGYFKWWADPPREVAADEIPDQFARVLNDRLPEAVELQVPIQQEDPTGPQQPGEPTRASEPRKPRSEPSGGGSPEVVSVEQRVQNSAVIKVLGSGRGTGAPFVQVVDPKDSGIPLEDQLGNKDRIEFGPGGLGGGPRTGPPTASLSERPQTDVVGPSGPSTTGRKKAEEIVPAAVDTEDLEGVESGSLNPDIFAEVLKRRWYPQALDCYIRVLKLFPNIGGKVSVSLTVGVAGNVTKIEVDGFNADVDACIAAAARKRWTFPKPDEPSTFDFVFLFRKAN
jgi:hypothetical protein